MLFDTHCHLDVPAFDDDRDAVFERAAAAGVARFLNPAFDLESSRRAVALTVERPGVFAAVGVHPNDAAGVLQDAGCLCEIYNLASEPGVVAIGEIGLDYHWDTSPRDVQRQVFVEQLDLARKLNLPVIIHCRSGSRPGDANAYDDLLEIVLARPWLEGRVLLHAFGGDRTQAARAVSAGFVLGFGGPLTYPKANNTRDIARWVPDGHFVIETDAPYLPPQSHRGRRNEPSYATDVAERLALVRGVTPEAVTRQATRNANVFFGLAD